MTYLCKHPQKLNLAILKSSRKALIFSYATSFFILSSFSLASAIASTPRKYVSNQMNASKSQSIPESELAATELKLLKRNYLNDPLSKRLQRLELLVFGSTQYGSSAGRWQNIQSFLQNKNGATKLNKSAGNNLSSALNDLEQYVFKKTSPTLSTSKRLDRLESKLFGQPTNSLNSEGRIARLQRTLGIPVTLGEMADLPKSNRALPPEINGENIPYFRHMQPGMPNTFGFNRDDMDDPDLSQFESQMNRMFGEMERRMQEQMQEAPNYQIQPRNPQRLPNFNAPHIIPRTPREKIPSYNDPNFI